MDEQSKMLAGVRIEGEFLGMDTAFYMDSDRNVACLLELKDEGLTGFLGIFDDNTKNQLTEYVEKLGHFTIPVLIWFHPEEGWDIDIQSEKTRFMIHSGKQGSLLLFDYGRQRTVQLAGIDGTAFDAVLDFLGVKELLFCYEKGAPTGKRLEYLIQKHGLSVPKYRSGVSDSTFLFYAKMKPSSVQEGVVRDALESDIFRLNELDLYVEVNTGHFKFLLDFPQIHTSVMDSRDLYLEITYGKILQFQMYGSFSFPALEGAGFAMNASFTEEGVEFTASSLPGQVYQIPNTQVVLSDMALSFGLSPQGIKFGLVAGIAIRQLALFGALHLTITEAGGIPVPDLLTVAMTEISLPVICKNILGMDTPAIEMLDIISIKPFGINCTEKLIPGKDTTRAQVAEFINKAGISEEFSVSEQEIALYLQFGGTYTLRVLDEQRMLHYHISEKGELAFCPQFYYASKSIQMGAYKFPKGMFFCGEINFLSTIFKVMYCALDGQGMIGFARISGVNCSVIKLTASQRSKQFPNPVTTDPDTMLSKLAGKDSGDDAMFYLSISRDKYSVYLDGHLELCGIFGVDAQIVYMDRKISIYTKLIIGGMFSITIEFAVDYSALLSSQFKFRLVFDAEPLYENLNELRGYVRNLAQSMKEKFSDADEQLRIAESQVLSLRNQISDLERDIAVSKSRINNAKWYQVWIAIEEGAKILTYEAAIGVLNLGMGVALGALEIARAAVKAVGWIGEKVLDAVDAVITGVMNAFYVRSLEFGIEVKPSHNVNAYELDITGSVKLTVIGNDISGSFHVNVPDIAGSLKSCLENALKSLIGGAFENVISFEDIPWKGLPETDMSKPYSHLIAAYEGPQSLPPIAGLAQEGVGRLEDGRQMIRELGNGYIVEMCEERPEFAELLTAYKDTASAGASLIGRVQDGVYKPAQELAQMMNELVTDWKAGNDQVSAMEMADVVEALEKYKQYTEPAMTDARQVRNRMRDVADSIDPDEGRYILHGMRMQNRINEDSEGIRIMEKRNYERLYNSMEDVVQKYFPMGESSNFIHLGNEPKFYEALNNSRIESGCASVDTRLMRVMMQRMRDTSEYAEGYKLRL